MFGQLSNRESLRDLVIALDALRSKCYHLGMGKNVSRSSLARANQDRNYHIFRSTPTAWSIGPERPDPPISSIWVATCMLSILPRLIFAFPCSGGQSSAGERVVSKCTHCMMWKHRYRHFFISPKLPFTIQRL